MAAAEGKIRSTMDEAAAEEEPDDMNEFQLMSQIELKPNKRETIIFTIDEHHNDCSVNFEYFLQNYEQYKKQNSKKTSKKK